MSREGEQDNSIRSFSLKNIAAWGLKSCWKEGTPYAALPPIQRGFIWKPEQIERLWDSIVQGFPIGSLLLETGKFENWHSYDGMNERSAHPEWQLLDGQQRATSIIKGFHDIWRCDNNDAVSALWVDLAPEGMEQTDRRFLFRLVTKSHPWGYKKSDPSQPLSASASHKALEKFRELNGYDNQKRAHKFNISEVFPWDAHAPVPLALLLNVINAEDVPEKLRGELNKTCMWQNAHGKHIAHFDNVEEILSNPNEQFYSLISGLKSAMETLQIPAPVLNVHVGDHAAPDEYHPTFNLFKRVNSGGTTLSNEEIQYSLLKSVWPKAPDIIEKNILREIKLCQPARMVSLLSRLFLMTETSAYPPFGSLLIFDGNFSIGKATTLFRSPIESLSFA